MGTIRDILQDLGTKCQNGIKGFSSPNDSYRSLERPLKVVKLETLGKSQGGPSKIGGSDKSIRASQKRLTLLLNELQSPTTTRNEPE